MVRFAMIIPLVAAFPEPRAVESFPADSTEQTIERRRELAKIGCRVAHPRRDCVGSKEQYYSHDAFLNSIKACHPLRAKVAVDLLKRAIKARNGKPLSGVALDLGSGCGDLWPLLNSSMVYLPSDLRERYFPVIECNLNHGQFPALRRPALLAVLGVFEYMCQSEEFLHGVRSIAASYTVFSYTPIEANLELYQKARLASNQTRPAMEHLLQRAGFRIVSRQRLRVEQMIEDVYVLSLAPLGRGDPMVSDRRNEQRMWSRFAARRMRRNRLVPPMESRSLTPRTLGVDFGTEAAPR